MERLRNVRFVLLVAMFLFYGISAFAKGVPFNRHYIILVDQTTNKKIEVIYNSLTKWLQGEKPSTVEGLDKNASTIPEAVKFDSINDVISLYAFGLTGDATPGRVHNKNLAYGKIFSIRNNEDERVIFNAVRDSLIHKRSRYLEGCYVPAFTDGLNIGMKMNLSEFLSKSLKRVCNIDTAEYDPLFKRIKVDSQSGVTLSYFVYPLIMDFISKEETANEYYLIIISDFKSGQYSNNDTEDLETLTGLIGAKNRAYFERQINSMRAPFVQADYLFFKAEGNGDGIMAAKGTRIVLKSVVQKSQIFLSTGLSVAQSSGTKFNFSDVRVAFDKDSMTNIDSIQIVVSEGGNVLCRKTIARGDEYIKNKLLNENREYEISAQTLDLGKSSLGDISVSYVLYTMSHDENGNSVLPVALTATQNIDSDNISMINKQLRKTMGVVAVILLTIGVLVLLIVRGRKKTLNVHLGSFAQKYMNVTDNEGAVELPCWFYHENETSKSIRVTGTILKRGLSIAGNTKLYVRLQDAKPNGFNYYINQRNATDFVEVKKSGDDFSFNINIEMVPNIVNPAELSKCGVRLDFLIESSILNQFKRRDVIDDIDDIEFYFFNDLGTAWVGFDPGTTGSCVSFGCTGGSLEDPNIEMVKNDDESIIPSKLVLTEDFGDRAIEELIPGIDFQYGFEADRNWEAHNRGGEPCFQSIKKLLGYKNSADDMIEVNWGGENTRKLTGLQLAHLLVKGLKKELDHNVSSLSQTDRMRYVGRTGKARRAVVAIPNNYTLPKITDMVNSVRMLGTFEEVRYIYEAEGILFNYFRKNYRTQRPGEETIMVYDMGGATINLSIFRVNYKENNGTIYYDVHTLGRIGYAVGGDNIDVALMECLFTLPQLTTSLSARERDENPQQAKEVDKKRHEYQLNHKLEILQKIVALKKDIVSVALGNSLEGSQIENQITMESTVNEILQQYDSLPADAFKDIPEENFAYGIIEKLTNSVAMKSFVMQNVKDAVSEILQYPAIEQLSKVDTLVFAGRSTMYPGIREAVMSTLRRRFKKVRDYDNFKGDEIKTSVSYGACWYGIYNSLVTLDNSRLSCAYGFKLTQGGSSRLNVLLNQNDNFDENGKISATQDVSNHFDADGNVVDFYQVMGSGKGENLFSENNRHKVNFIGSIDVTTTTSEIGMAVDRRNVVTCKVTFDTGDVSSFRDLNIVGRDITKENDWAYVFAATPQPKSSNRPQTPRRSEQPHFVLRGSSNPSSHTGRGRSGGGANRV